mmetsp:Transcript_20406/g.63990  ORF Transcript_20406/g.63990 Transcript_20406/m.63990 type:complete len:206 (+) Transcript_20406:1010-1627(+)
MRGSARPSTALPRFQASAKLSASMVCPRSRSSSPRRAFSAGQDAELTASSSSLSVRAGSCSSMEKHTPRPPGCVGGEAGGDGGASGASGGPGSGGGSASGDGSQTGEYSSPWPWSSVRTNSRSSLRLLSPSCSCERLRVAARGSMPTSRSRSARLSSGRCLRSCCRQKCNMWYPGNGRMWAFVSWRRMRVWTSTRRAPSASPKFT